MAIDLSMLIVAILVVSAALILGHPIIALWSGVALLVLCFPVFE